MLKNPFSQSSVYKSMLQTAAESWNVRESDLTGLDPSYKLLMNALAKELEKVGHELKGAEARMLKRMARQIMPNALQSVLPAHGVIHFTPTEKVELSCYDHFSYEKRWHNKEKFNRLESRDIHFTSAAPLHMYPSRIKYRIDAERVLALEGAQQEVLDLPSPLRDPRSIVLGISKLRTSSLQFYFDWFKDVEKKSLFNLLGKLRITLLDGSPLASSHGFASSEKSVGSNILDQLSTMKMMEQFVVNFYSNRFLNVELASLSAEQSRDAVPEAYRSLVEELDPDSECTWLALHFPDEASEQLVHDAFVQINCFPALNRKMERQVFRLQPDLNIKKLDFEGAFLDVERVESAEGRAYAETRHIAGEVKNPGTYTIRRAGVGRLDEREASEYLRYMLDLLKEEKQAFASVDASSTASDLKKIEQAIARVEKRVESSGLRNNRPYILLSPHKQSENVYIYFWSTFAAFANGINRESAVECNTAGISISGQAQMLTDSTGGEDELSDSMLVERYKSSLLTKEVIVTKADIISHCKAIGGEDVKEIIVSKEVEASSQRGHGLMQVLRVGVRFTGGLETEKKNYVIQRMESELQARSNFSIPLNVCEQSE